MCKYINKTRKYVTKAMLHFIIISITCPEKVAIFNPISSTSNPPNNSMSRKQSSNTVRKLSYLKP